MLILDEYIDRIYRSCIDLGSAAFVDTRTFIRNYTNISFKNSPIIVKCEYRPFYFTSSFIPLFPSYPWAKGTFVRHYTTHSIIKEHHGFLKQVFHPPES